MSTVEAALIRLEKIGDYLNSILVKETRQSFKSRQFIATFMLLLLVSWLISLFAVLIWGDSINFGSKGRDLFLFYYTVLLVAITVIVPFGAYRSMMGEQDLNTYDLLSITTLTPRQIVWGKLLSALLQVFIYYSAIAPFIAFTALLEGFDLPAVAFSLGVGLVISFCFSVVALMVSTAAKQRHWQGLLSIGLLGGLVSGFFTTSISLAQMFQFSNPFEEPNFWWGVLITLLIVLSYAWLCLQITTAQLTFEAGNRSSGIRITSTIQLLLIWGGVTAYFVSQSRASELVDYLLPMSIASILHLAMLGLAASTEEDYLSRRIRKSLPKSGLARLIYAPFLPGGARGFACFLGIMALLLGFQCLWLYLEGSSLNVQRSFNAALALDCYLVIYLGTGCWFGRFASKLSSDIRPGHVRVLIILMAAAGMIVPVITASFDWISFNRFSLAWVSNPFMTVPYILSDNFEAKKSITILMFAAGSAILINVRAMFLALSEIANAKVERPLRPVAENHPFQIPAASDILPDPSSMES